MTNLVFCDFDGTVTRRDVGYSLFRHFSGGRNEALIPEWKSGALSTRDCLRLEAAMVKASPEEIYAFLNEFELTPGFVEFAALCRRNGADLTMLSDGLDFYIAHLAERFGIADVPFLANTGRLDKNGITVSFPHDNRTCRRCGSCKGERIEEFRAAVTGPSRTIFVGDGYSDVCAMRAADVVFAKKDLEEYCGKHNIEFFRYDDFFDVAGALIRLGYFRG
jgi:2-hydroxy-3-keto-5-methylthiopentenyl-1-phosphate phosphatase